MAPKRSRLLLACAVGLPVVLLLAIAGTSRYALGDLTDRLQIIESTRAEVTALEGIHRIIEDVSADGALWDVARTAEAEARTQDHLARLLAARTTLTGDETAPLVREIESFVSDASAWLTSEQAVEDAVRPVSAMLVEVTDDLRGLSARTDRARDSDGLVAANRAIAEVQTAKLILFADTGDMSRKQIFAVSQGHLMAARAFLAGTAHGAAPIVDDLRSIQDLLRGIGENAPERASVSGLAPAASLSNMVIERISTDTALVDATAARARDEVLGRSEVLSWTTLGGALLTLGIGAVAIRARPHPTGPQAEVLEPSADTLVSRALEATDTLIMLADRDGRIAHVNPALQQLFEDAETDIRQDVPTFEARTVIGSDIETLHSDLTQHVESDPHTAEPSRKPLHLGGRHFDVAISPVHGADGAHLGTVIAWHDRTQSTRAQAEIDRVVANALHGNFKDQAALTDAPPPLQTSGEQINQLVRSIDNNLTGARRVITAFAGGNLTERMRQEGEGAFKDLREGVNGTVENLAELVRDIKNAVDTMQSATDSIATGAEALASRAVSQASRLEETAATMEEMTATIKSNAESADSARSLAVDASGQASKGGDVVDETISAMSRIETSSGKISDIISVIDSIAFQTNLLALNAAVEAARAGDAGKGFAVVASEVRTLAQRSAEAAKDISALISESTAQVADGVNLVHRTGTALTDIVGSVKRVSDTMEDISTATREQSSGIEEIASAVHHMDQMTQQNSSMAEQSAAAARDLAHQSTRLAQLMGHFKLGDPAGDSEAQADAVWRDVERRATPDPLPPKPTSLPVARSPAVAAQIEDDEDWASF